MNLALRHISQRALLGILLVALAVRATVLVKNWNNLDFAASYMLHGEVARNILDGRWFQKDTAYLNQYYRDCVNTARLIDFEDYPPPTQVAPTPLYNDEGGYGVFVALTWKVFGAKRWWYVRVIQVLMDVALCWMVYRIGYRLFEVRAGLAASALYAVFIPGIEIAVRPHRDFWVTALFVTTAFILTNDSARRQALRFALVGVATGVVATMRSTAVAFGGFVGAAALALSPSTRTIRNVVVLGGAFALFFSPVLVRNYSVFGKVMATRGAFWHSFWGGVGQMPNPYGVREDDRDIIRFVSTIDSSVQYDTEAYEQVLKREALRLLADHPVWYASSVLRRAAVIVYPRAGRALFFQPPAEEYRVGFVNRMMGSVQSIVVDAVLGTLFLAALWVYRKSWRRWFWLLVPYIYTVITLAPFYVTGRNIANVYFVVLLFASAAAVALYDRWSGKQTSPADSGAGFSP